MKKLFLFALIATLFSGCSNKVTYPDIPTLEFKSMAFGNDGGAKTFTMTATFTDGDGDIGYYQDGSNEPIFDDSSSQYYYNFVIELQVYRNGIWNDTAITYIDINYNSDTTETDNDTTYTLYNDLISSRLPFLTQDGQNKGLKGDIDKTAYLPFIPAGDTLRFRAFIYDRSLNKSNEIYTPGYFIQNP
jgi:hypothetical protein